MWKVFGILSRIGEEEESEFTEFVRVGCIDQPELLALPGFFLGLEQFAFVWSNLDGT